MQYAAVNDSGAISVSILPDQPSSDAAKASTWLTGLLVYGAHLCMRVFELALVFVAAIMAGKWMRRFLEWGNE